MIETLTHLDLSPFVLSFKLAGVTTLLLFFVSLPFAWYLSQSRSKTKPFMEALTALPMVLPPSVLGFYFLMIFNQIELNFTFTGLVIASCLYSFPFMVQPLQGGFESLNKNMLEASYLAGKSKFKTLLFVALPNIKPALLTALIITFSHTIGEFGVILMIGGSIPGETKVASIAIYEMVEIMDYSSAHIYSLIMLLISFVVLLSVYVFNHSQKRVGGFH